MSESTVVNELETILRRRAAELTTPRDGECLLCFVARTVDELGCDTTLRWAKAYCATRAPGARALEKRLGQVGGFCDCEIFMNGFELVDSLLVYDPELGEQIEPETLPPCGGVRGGSTQPCGNWRRQRRGW